MIENTQNLNEYGQPVKKKKSITWIGFLYLLFFTLYSWDNTNKIVLYGGFSVVMVSTFIFIIFSGDRGTIHVYDLCKKLFYFMIYCVASFFWAWSGTKVFEQSILLVLGTLMVIVMTSYFVEYSSEDIILVTIACMGVGLAIRVIFSYGGMGAMYNEALSLETARLGSEINNVNAIGMRCTYATMVLFYYANYKSKRICYFILIFPIVVSIITGSRKAILALFLGLVLLIYMKERKIKTIGKYFKYLCFIIAFILGFSLILRLEIMSTFTKRMTLFFNMFGDGTAQADKSSVLRGQMIVVALKQFIKSPLAGIGHANSAILNLVTLHFPAYSHNDYAEILVNGGLIGFIMYYYHIIYKILRYHMQLMKKSDDSVTVISFCIMVIFLLMNIACVTYYDSFQTYIFLMLWITHIELKRKDGVLE